MSRETFLSRVRQAAQVGQAHRVQLHPVPSDVGYVGVPGDLCERFASEVQAVGGEVHVVPDLFLARGVLEKLLDDASSRHTASAVPPTSRQLSRPLSALCWQHELLTRLGLDELLRARHMQRLDFLALAALPRQQQRDAMFASQIGITSCDCAIAETGSLMLGSRTGRERVASLLPPVHVAIIERRQIVPDLMDTVALLGRGGGNDLPSNAVLITGPSKTGDIELQLTTGVHGPGEWHVILIA